MAYTHLDPGGETYQALCGPPPTSFGPNNTEDDYPTEDVSRPFYAPSVVASREAFGAVYAPDDGHAYGSDTFDEPLSAADEIDAERCGILTVVERPYLAALPARAPIDAAHEAVLAAYDTLRVPQYSEAARSRYWEAVGEAKGLLRAANIIGAQRATSEKGTKP